MTIQTCFCCWLSHSSCKIYVSFHVHTASYCFIIIDDGCITVLPAAVVALGTVGSIKLKSISKSLLNKRIRSFLCS